MFISASENSSVSSASSCRCHSERASIPSISSVGVVVVVMLSSWLRCRERMRWGRARRDEAGPAPPSKALPWLLRIRGARRRVWTAFELQRLLGRGRVNTSSGHRGDRGDRPVHVSPVDADETGADAVGGEPAVADHSADGAVTDAELGGDLLLGKPFVQGVLLGIGHGWGRTGSGRFRAVPSRGGKSGAASACPGISGTLSTNTTVSVGDGDDHKRY